MAPKGASHRYSHALLCKDSSTSTGVAHGREAGCKPSTVSEESAVQEAVLSMSNTKHLCQSQHCVNGSCSKRPSFSRSSSIAGCASDSAPVKTVWGCRLALQCLNLTLTHMQTFRHGDQNVPDLPLGCNYVMRSQKVYFQPYKGGSGRIWAQQLCKLKPDQTTRLTAVEPSSEANFTTAACSARRCMASGRCTTVAKYTSSGCAQQNETSLLSRSLRLDPGPLDAANNNNNWKVEMRRCVHAQKCLGLDAIAVQTLFGDSPHTYNLSQRLPAGCLYNSRMKKRFLNLRWSSIEEKSSDMPPLGSVRLSLGQLKQGWHHVCLAVI